MLKKSIITACIIFISITTLNAQVTMCFKKNHQDIATIENIKLEGGECNSKNSLSDMKKIGWIITDIKITPTSLGTDFIYLLKKETSNENSNAKVLLDKVYKQIEIEKVTKEEDSKKILAIESIKAGEKFFLNTCAVCHGKKGELKAKGVSRVINSLDFEDFKTSIRDYGNNQEGVMAMLMAQYANAMDSRDVKNVYEYLKSINSQK